MIEFTREQNTAADEITKFLVDDTRQVFSLQGYAGTGKTTLMTVLAQIHNSWLLCALTGKAASVLSQKSGLNASTIHSLFYKFVGNEKDPVTGRLEPQFVKVHAKDSLVGQIVLVDESSMINSEMASDLLKSGAKIITSGDPMQLRPIKGIGAFTGRDAMLVEVHRQALESPIIRQATAVRSGFEYNSDGDDFRIVQEVSDDDLLWSDAILCWKNITRAVLNAKMRELKGFSGTPKAGEPIMFLKNVKEHGIFNGEIYTLANDFNKRGVVRIIKNGLQVGIGNTNLIDPLKNLSEFDPLGRYSTVFDYGYSMTVHKAQGTEFDKVVILDEYTKYSDRTNWIYTAITRSKQKVIIQK